MFNVNYFSGDSESGRVYTLAANNLMEIHALDDKMHYPESYIIGIKNLVTGETFDDLNDIYESEEIKMGGRGSSSIASTGSTGTKSTYNGKPVKDGQNVTLTNEDATKEIIMMSSVVESDLVKYANSFESAPTVKRSDINIDAESRTATVYTDKGKEYFDIKVTGNAMTNSTGSVFGFSDAKFEFDWAGSKGW